MTTSASEGEKMINTFQDIKNAVLIDHDMFDTLAHPAWFMEWAKFNMKIVQEFQDNAIYLRNVGRRTVYGADVILGKMRWDSEVRGDDEFKINSQAASFLSRLIMAANEECEELFRTRKGGGNESNAEALLEWISEE